MKQFGGKVTKQLLNQYEQSPNWRDGKFQNLVQTEMEFSLHSLPNLLYKQFIDRKGREPKEPLKIQPIDQAAFLAAKETQIIWFGHSVILMRINNQTILIDPMLGPDASPIAPFSTKRFSKDTLSIIDQLPEIDLLLMTHDHYDHLDMASIHRLAPKVKQYFVGLGVKRHLAHWGVNDKLITEFDWWNHQSFEELTIAYTPTRHFSGRGMTDRAKSMWGGWVIRTQKENIYFSGDGGYGEHFKEVGEKLGPFDFGIMECGQYNKEWHQIHLYPEEAIQAAIDAKVKNAMPVHWAGFALSLHTWTDPVERFMKEAAAQQLNVITPQLGEMIDYQNYQTTDWWSKLD